MTEETEKTKKETILEITEDAKRMMSEACNNDHGTLDDQIAARLLLHHITLAKMHGEELEAKLALKFDLDVAENRALYTIRTVRDTDTDKPKYSNEKGREMAVKLELSEDEGYTDSLKEYNAVVANMDMCENMMKGIRAWLRNREG